MPTNRLPVRAFPYGRLALSLLASLLSALPVDAAVQILSQERRVRAYASATDDFDFRSEADSAAAPGNDPFSAPASATAEVSAAYASVGASQTSSLGPGGFLAEGNLGMSAEGWDFGGYADASGRTRFEVEFVPDAPLDYAITGWIEAYDNGDAHWHLTGATAGELHSDNAFNENLAISVSGTLAAGETYTLFVEASGSAYGDAFSFDYASGAFDVAMAFPGATGAPVVATADTGALRAYPNPFRSETSIAWSAPRATPASVVIHDVAGRVVRRLEAPAGGASIAWDGRDAAGRRTPAGVYLVRAAGAEGVRTTKILHVR